MVSDSEVANLDYEPIVLSLSDFTAGPDNGSQLNAGTVGEIANMEVGSDGQASNYEAVRVGQPASELDPEQGKQFMKLANGAGGTVADSAEYRFIGRKKNKRDGQNLAGFFKHRNKANADPRQRASLPPARDAGGNDQIVKEGRLVALQGKDETGSVTFSISAAEGAEAEIPALGGS